MGFHFIRPMIRSGPTCPILTALAPAKLDKYALQNVGVSQPKSGWALSDRSQLTFGPSHIVSRWLPDNREFWRIVNAVKFTQRGVGRREVYRAVAYYVGLTEARECFASVATLSDRAGLGTSATREQLRALERDGDIEGSGNRRGGHKPAVYTLPAITGAVPKSDTKTLTVLNRGQRLPLGSPTVNVGEEGTEEELRTALTAAVAVLPVPVPKSDTDQQQRERRITEKRQDRIEGLFAACAVRARKLGLTYDEADERARLKKGETTLGGIQALADELQHKIAASRRR